MVDAAVGGDAEITRAGTLAEAKRLLGTGDFDLILLDLGLPDGDGMDLLPAMKAAGKESIPVMVVSVSEVSPSTARRVSRAVSLGDVDLEGIGAAVRGLLGSKHEACLIGGDA